MTEPDGLFTLRLIFIRGLLSNIENTPANKEPGLPVNDADATVNDPPINTNAARISADFFKLLFLKIWYFMLFLNSHYTLRQMSYIILPVENSRNHLRVHCDVMSLFKRALTIKHGFEIGVLAFIGVLSLAIHLLPFILYGSHPLGYDTGFYRRYLIEPFLSFPNAAVPGLGENALIPRMFLDALRLLPFSADYILYGSYIALFVLLSVTLYFFLRSHVGIRGAAIAALLLVLSSVQYKAYWYMLWKHAFAACLLFLALIALERRWTALLVFLDIALAWSHTTTAIIYLLTLVILFIVHAERKRIFIHGAITALAFVMVNASLVHQIYVATPVAVFLDWSEYIVFSIPIFIVIITARIWRISNIPLSLWAFTAVSFAFPLLKLPFFERIFIYSDIALIALAGFAIERMVSQMNFETPTKRTYLHGAILCITLGLFLSSLWGEVRSSRPLISEEIFDGIAEISAIVPSEATILTTSDEAPWFEGWTSSHIAAPGMLRDTHNLDEWTTLWTSTSTEKQIEFLGEFPQPLYIASFNGFEDLIGTPAPCLLLLTPHLLSFDVCAQTN